MRTFKFTNKQADLIGESVLAKIHQNRKVIEMITSVDACKALQREIEKLNEILTLLAERG